MAEQADFLIWTDEETTGLEREDHMLEIACILTDPQLNVIATFASLVRPNAETFDRLRANPIVLQMHEANGLLAALEEGGDKLPTLEDVEAGLVAFIEQHVASNKVIMMAGGGVGHFDLGHIRHWMPSVTSKLHYGTVDVSDVVRGYLCATGNHETFAKNPNKAHRALADIEDDLRIAATAWDMFQMYEARRLSGEHAATPTERVLAGASILQAASTADGDATLTAILDEVSSRDVIAGVTAVATEVLRDLAEHTGKPVAELLSEVRLRAIT